MKRFISLTGSLQQVLQFYCRNHHCYFLKMKASEAVTTFGETLNELKHRFIQLVWFWLLLLLRTIQVYLQLWLWLYRIRVMRLLSSRHFWVG